MLSAADIAKAKQTTLYRDGDVHHEHDDSIRIAYEWLDAQQKTKLPVQKSRALKHLIEQWAGRYVSQSDVEVAAHMHPDIIGTYPRYNISARVIEPKLSRLDGIPEANTHLNYREIHRGTGTTEPKNRCVANSK